MSFNSQPIKRKLMLMILLTSGSVLLIISALVITYEWLTFRRALVENVTTLAEVIARNSTAALAFNNSEDAADILSGLRAEQDVRGAALYDKQGKLFAQYLQMDKTANIPVKPGNNGWRFTEKRLIVFVPVIESGEKHGTLYVEASLNSIFDRLFAYAQIVILLFIVCFVAALLLSNVLQKSISAPLLSLAGAAKAVSEKKDYSVRAVSQSKDEIGMLTATFNDMLSQIQVVDAGLRRALGEKDVLIQEIHHRVKNNLQVILSLIDMQSRSIENEEVAEVFMDCKSRIRSMALVHEMLYRTADFSRIEFPIYAERLTRDLLKMYQPASCTIDSIIDLKTLNLDINRAVPLGLLFNEIITNSLKHAFQQRTHGTIFLEQRAENGIVLIAGDDGNGLPESIDFANPQSFGLKIIQLLVEQLDGKIYLNRANGTRYEIHFNR